MELVVLIPVVLIMSGVALARALKEQPLTATASTAYVAPGPAARAKKTPAMSIAARSAATIETTVLTAKTAQTETNAEGNKTEMDARFSQTDVLLADALTEMIGLKAELYHLRSKIDSLNTEVSRLSGNHLRPLPPGASKKPVPMKKAA